MAIKKTVRPFSGARTGACLAFFLFVIVLPVSICAEPFEFIYRFEASGTFGGRAFSAAQIEVVGRGQLPDLSGVDFTKEFSIWHETASLSISGIGEFQIRQPTRTLFRQIVPPYEPKGLVSFRYFDVMDIGAIALTHPTLADWKMATAVGPLPGSGALFFNSVKPLRVEPGGTRLWIDQTGAEIEFQAVVGGQTKGRNFGVFVGSYRGWHWGDGLFPEAGFLPNDAFGDVDRMKAALDRYMSFGDRSTKLKLYWEDEGQQWAVLKALQEIGAEMSDEDTLVFFYSGHGATEIPATGAATLQYLAVGHQEHIADQNLMEWLRDYVPQGAKKVVILETCHGGGFWDSALDSVPNTTLLASSAWDHTSPRRFLGGAGIYASALVSGLQAHPIGSLHAMADLDGNGLTFKELHEWARIETARNFHEFEGQDLPVSAIKVALGTAKWTSVTVDIYGDDSGIGGGIATEQNHPPVASIGGSMVAFAPSDGVGSVELVGEHSFDPDGNVLTFEWSLGGAFAGSSPNLALQLPQGEYEVQLIVHDGELASEPTIVTATVGTLVQFAVKPGDDAPRVNWNSNGVIPLAVMGEEGFDVGSIASATVNGIAPVRSALDDVNGDGLPDLVLKVKTQDLVTSGIPERLIFLGLTEAGFPLSGVAAAESVH